MERSLPYSPLSGLPMLKDRHATCVGEILCLGSIWPKEMWVQPSLRIAIVHFASALLSLFQKSLSPIVR